MSRFGRGRPACAGTMFALFLLCLFVLLRSPVALADASPLTLDIGQTISLETKADQTLEFRVNLAAGKAYLFDLDQAGFEYLVKLTDPDGNVTVFDFPTFRGDPTHRDERELLLFEPGVSGEYIISAFTEDFTGATGYPRVSLTLLDSGNDLLPAYRLMTEAAEAFSEIRWQDALAKLEQAVPLLDDPAHAGLLGRCLMGGGIQIAWEAFDYDRSRDWTRRAAQAWLAAGEDLLASEALQLNAAIKIEQTFEIEKTPSRALAPEARALFDDALALLQQALETQRVLGARFNEAGTLNMIGYGYHMMGDVKTALEYYSHAGDLYRELLEWEAESWPVNNIGVLEFAHGYIGRAIEAWSRFIEILPPDKRTGIRADLLDNLGASYVEFGNFDLALKSYSTAMEMHEAAANPSGTAMSMVGLGNTYLAIGETELGMEYLESALPIRRKAKHGPSLISLLNILAREYLKLGNYEAAFEALSEAEQISAGARYRSRTLINLGDYQLATGNPEQALDHLSQAEQVTREAQLLTMRAEALEKYGEAWIALEEFGKALETYRTADAIFSELGLVTEQSRTLFGMSRSYAGLSEPGNAVRYAEQAIETVENHRASLSSPQLRAFFMSQRQDYYAHLVSTLISLQASDVAGDQSHLRKAFNYSERSRARSLVDLINEAGLGATATKTSEERDALYRKLAEARFRLLGKSEVQQTADELDAARQQLADIENRLNVLEIERREADPAYAKLVDPTILDVESIQAMLGEENALLHYVLGKEKSFVFLVTPRDIEVWTLPGKEQIEKDALDIYGLLRTPSQSREQRGQLNSQIVTFARSVLPPAEALNQKQILVVADGVLQYLPFSVLLASNGAGDPDSSVSSHELVNVPSMSVLAAQRRINGDRTRPKRAISIFADPVFSSDDRRLAIANNETPTTSTELTVLRAFSPTEPTDLERLPATKFEAETIAALVAPDSAEIHTGFQASRDVVLNAALSDFRVVHFATHGKIDSRYPALSWLAFSQFDEQGNTREGLVRLHDIYGLDLNAELVTMSACDTALGREISGEGLTGLVQGFMYSGARSVLASLWQVPDRATAELMGHFYRNLFEQQQKPAEALRNAQLALSSQARWRHPYFWSAFVLQGDWE